MKTTTLLKLMATVLLVVASAVFLAACSGSSAEDSPADDAAEHIDDSSNADEHDDPGEGDMQSAHISLTEWAILGEGEEPVESLPSGDVMLEVHNDGAAVHQFAVWRGGEVIGDEVQGGELVAETDFISPGGMVSLDVPLEPGQYVLTCPVIGHTERGMHTDTAVEIEVQ